MNPFTYLATYAKLAEREDLEFRAQKRADENKVFFADSHGLPVFVRKNGANKDNTCPVAVHNHSSSLW